LSNAIVFYVSGHGFGHASRVIEVVNAILARRPETRIGVRTAAPRWLFDLTIKGRVMFSHLETDTGIVQVDSLTLDEADSIRRAAAFHGDLVTRAATETRVLRELGAGLVVGDIPPLAFAVAAAAGLPSVAIGNFTWDWIYADYPRVRLAPSLLPTIRAAYAKASMSLRLPMSGGFEQMANVKDIPFIARHATKTREEVTRALKLPSDKPIVLVSFGGYGLDALDIEPLTKFKKYTVVTTTNTPLGRARKEAGSERRGSFVSLAEEAVYDAGIRYEDLVAAADAVVTKPGYGIISESIANNTAVLYTLRGHFPEYDVLVEHMPKYLRNAFISHDDLFAGHWEPHLDKLLAQPEPKKKPETDGADVAAEILLKALDKPPRKPRGRVKVKI
jgi:L-arabinokinase